MTFFPCFGQRNGRSYTDDDIKKQCAAVNFVAGVSSSIPSACTNASGNSAAFVSDTTLLPASASDTAAPTTTGSKTVATTTSPSSATSTAKLSGAEKIIKRVRWWAGIAGLLLMVAMLL
jgi:hypothetical protein